VQRLAEAILAGQGGEFLDLSAACQVTAASLQDWITGTAES